MSDKLTDWRVLFRCSWGVSSKPQCATYLLIIVLCVYYIFSLWVTTYRKKVTTNLFFHLGAIFGGHGGGQCKEYLVLYTEENTSTLFNNVYHIFVNNRTFASITHLTTVVDNCCIKERRIFCRFINFSLLKMGFC